MKKFYKYTLLLTAVFLFAPLASRAQQNNSDVIKVDKQVTQTPDDKGQYWITLETFVTGTSVQTTTPVPSDIVLVLDVSGSMADRAGNSVSTLEVGKMYAFTRQGYSTRFGKVFLNNGRYYLQYSTDYGSLPNNFNDGSNWSGYNNLTSIPSVPASWTAYKSRITLMQEAVKSFVRTVKQKGDENNVVHNIAIVKFANNQIAEDSYRNGTREVYPTNNATQGSTDIIALTNATQCDAAIDALYPGGGTYSDYGLAAAKNIFTNSGVDGHPKVTVFFTDGQPGRSDWDNTVAVNAVNYAYDIKNLKVKFNGVEKEGYSTVYSIGLLTSESTSGTRYDVRRFMHYVSSNYTYNITNNNFNFRSDWVTNDGAGNWNPQTRDGYYKLTTDGADLGSIFQSIAGEAGQPAFELGESSVVTLDVISNHFTLPEGSDYDAVLVYAVDVKSISNETPPTYTFYTEEEGGGHWTLFADASNTNDAGDYHNPAQAGDADKKILIDRTNQTIRVQNFDYANNCVRKESNGTVHGKKLVMKIPIIVNAANPGGANVETNKDAGIYVDGTKIPGIVFPTPKVVLPNIIIRKYGLKRYGECASFLVQRTDENGTPLNGDDKLEYNLIVTYERGKAFPEPEEGWGEWVFAQIKLQKDGYYKVTETTWAWNYTPSTTTKYLTGKSVYPADNTDAAGNEVTGGNYMVRHVGVDTEQEDDATGLKGAIFDFRNTLKNSTSPEPLSNYNESSKVNIFHPKEIDPALLQGK